MRGCGWGALLVLVACGNDRGATTGAPVDASGSTVTVVVTAFGVPAPGVQVYFQDADSVVVTGGSALTGADGSVSAAMPAGGFVTAISPPVVTPPYVETIAGVEPGDVLHLEIAGPPAAGSAISVELTTPADATAGVAGYQFYTTCSAAPVATASTSARVALTGCAGGLADVLVMTTDGSGAVVDSLYEAGVAVGTGSVALTGSYAPVSPLSDVITDFAVAPPYILAGITLVTPHGRIGLGSSSVPPPIGSAASLAFAWPSIPDGEALTVFDVGAGSNVLDAQLVSQYGPSSAQPVTIDFAGDQLRDVLTVPTFDASTRTIAWSLGAVGVTPDVETAYLQVTRGSGSAAAPWGWQILAPGGDEARVVLPVLPSEPVDFNIRTDDAVTVGIVQGAASPGGAAALRSLGLSGLQQPLYDRAGATVWSSAYGNGVRP